jgi:predicted nucleic acid-binding Zn ribbon protein
MLHSHKCEACGKPLSGRIDKKFCDDQCRATFNNRNKRPHEQNMQRVNAQLRRNRTILKSLCPVGKATVRREVMDEMGFSFGYFTSLHGKHPKVYFLCYDYAFMPLIERSVEHKVPIQKVLIVQRQSFMAHFDPWTL